MKPNMFPTFHICHERSDHAAAIAALHADVFGPGCFARTAFRVREGFDADPRFSFVAEGADGLVGSVRLTPVFIGADQGYLLGPLCVVRGIQGRGVGRTLVHHAVGAVHALLGEPVLLVGDESYYGALGFKQAGRAVRLPGPVDQSRVLVASPDDEAPSYAGNVYGRCL